jgi:hypothetical protein
MASTLKILGLLRRIKRVIFNNFLIIKEPRMFEAAYGGRVPQGSPFYSEQKADPGVVR